MSGTHRALLFGSKSRCFASKNHRWGLGPIETKFSDANHPVLQAQNDRWGLGPIDTCYSDANHAVLQAHNDRSCLGHIETCHSGPEVAVLHAKATSGVLDPPGPPILVLKALFCMHKTTGKGWNKYSLFILVLKSLFCIQKPQMRAGTHRD